MSENDARGDTASPGVKRTWRTVDEAGRVTGVWREAPPVHGETWVRHCIATHWPECQIEVQVTTVSDWMPDPATRPTPLASTDETGAGL